MCTEGEGNVLSVGDVKCKARLVKGCLEEGEKCVSRDAGECVWRGSRGGEDLKHRIGSNIKKQTTYIRRNNRGSTQYVR